MHDEQGSLKKRSLLRRHFLAIALIAGGLATASTAQADLVFQMDFNDASGSASLVDRGTTGETGAFTTRGASYSTTVAPSNTGGFSGSFNGTSGAADFGDISALDGLTTMTITAWIRPDGLNPGGSLGSGRIVHKRMNVDGFVFYYHDSDLELEFVGEGGVTNGGGSFAGQQWTWVAVTYDGTQATNNVTFYTGDGTKLSAGSMTSLDKGALLANRTALRIGNNRVGTRTYSGLIDNVRIYNSVEDAASLTSIMQFDDVGTTVDIPEPGTYALLAGLFGLVCAMMRRRR
jgi:hypothetical protein